MSTKILKPLLTSLLLALVTGCSGGTSQPQIQVIHRCGDTNYEQLNGYFGRLRDANQIDSKFRFLFATKDGTLSAKWVPGDYQGVLFTGKITGPERITLTSASGKRTLEMGLNDSCRLTVKESVTQGASSLPNPDSEQLYAPYDELKLYDFEPCTERLYIRRAAKSYSTAQKERAASKPPVVREDRLAIAAWSPNDLPVGCEAEMDLWVDGGAEAYGLKTVVKKNGKLHWSTEFETQYLGLHGLSLHRIANCQGEKQVLGVACTRIEVK